MDKSIRGGLVEGSIQIVPLFLGSGSPAGEKIFLLGSRNARFGFLDISDCGPTLVLDGSDASAVLKMMSGYLQGRSGVILGFTPHAGPLTVQSGSGRKCTGEVQSNSIVFADIEPGDYRIVGPEAYRYFLGTEIEAAWLNIPPRDVRLASIYQISSGGAISGQVIGPNGKPAEGIRLELVPFDKTSNAPLNQRSTRSSKNGYFYFGGVPEGNYALAALCNRKLDATWFSSSYYGFRVSHLSAKRPILVKPGQLTGSIQFDLPPMPRIVRMRIQFTGSSYRPRSEARFELRTERNHENINRCGLLRECQLDSEQGCWFEVAEGVSYELVRLGHACDPKARILSRFTGRLAGRVKIPILP
ncbi:MAG: carboxypeptidase-like regulatory domain-containing protein [Bryobacter sp.]|nr:carboxypeptidase-like regulatory domain-containing protein [Bryobacter sp.]